MRMIAPIAIALLLTCCATKPPEASYQERDEAILALDLCLHAAARKLDDGRSKASIIALGLKTLCAGEFARSRDVYARSLNPAAAQIFHRRDDEVFMQAATTAVLDERAKGRR
jgi:hypothetical protein